MQIRKQWEDATSDYDKEKLQERIAKLAGGVVVIKVGAVAEVEMKEKKDRIDDALHATRAAVEEGSGNFGYNAATGEYGDMVEMGILDPTKVTRVALENAASVSGMILTTACTLVDIKEDAPAGGGMPPMGGGMPGMM